MNVALNDATVAHAAPAQVVTDPTPEQLERIESSLDYQFLDSQRLDDYIAHAGSAAAPLDARFGIFDGAAGLPDDRFPLTLCEFLAYKSALAYHPKPKELEEHLVRDCRGIAHPCCFDSEGIGGDTQGFAFLLGDTAFIIMRGTMGLADWQGNFDRHPTDDDKDKLSETDLKLVGSIKPGRHRGFAKGWGGVRDKVEAWIATLPAPPLAFVFSGHSLGGALALLGAYEFAALRNRNVAAVVTFGAVMPGRKDFAEDYERLLGKRTIRIESHEDAVPISLLLLGYVPVGRKWIVDKRPLASWWRMLFVKSGAKPAPGAAAADQAASPTAVPAGNARAVTQAVANTALASAPQSAPKPAVDDKYWNLRIGGWSTRIDKSQPLMQKLLAALAFLLFVLLMKLLWLAVKGSITAYRGHSMEKRYALYLTTLSYRRLRALRGNRDEDYERAYADLKTHLAYVRGSNDQFYRGVLKRPAKIKSVRDAARTMDTYESYIC